MVWGRHVHSGSFINFRELGKCRILAFGAFYIGPSSRPKRLPSLHSSLPKMKIEGYPGLFLTVGRWWTEKMAWGGLLSESLGIKPHPSLCTPGNRSKVQKKMVKK